MKRKKRERGEEEEEETQEDIFICSCCSSLPGERRSYPSYPSYPRVSTRKNKRKPGNDDEITPKQPSLFIAIHSQYQPLNTIPIDIQPSSSSLLPSTLSDWLIAELIDFPPTIHRLPPHHPPHHPNHFNTRQGLRNQTETLGPSALCTNDLLI